MPPAQTGPMAHTARPTEGLDPYASPAAARADFDAAAQVWEFGA